MISLSLNVVLSSEEDQSYYKQKIHCSYTEITAQDGNAITQEDFKYIKTQVDGGEEMAYYRQYAVLEGNQDPLYLLFVEPMFYKQVMGMESPLDSQTVYIGKGASEIFSSGFVLQDDRLKAIYNEKEQTFFGQAISSFAPLDEANNKMEMLLSDLLIATYNTPITFDSYIIFPLTDQELPDCSSHIVLPTRTENEDAVNGQVVQIQEYLLTVHTDGEYLVRNYAAEIQDWLSGYLDTAKYINLLSVFVLIIVSLGLCGLLLIQINRRKQEIAIALMCGAVHRQIAIEIFLEIAVVVLGSLIVGNILSIFIQPLLFSGLVSNVRYYFRSMLICTFGAALLSGIICMVSIHRLKYISPVQTLKTL